MSKESEQELKEPVEPKEPGPSTATRVKKTWICFGPNCILEYPQGRVFEATVGPGERAAVCSRCDSRRYVFEYEEPHVKTVSEAFRFVHETYAKSKEELSSRLKQAESQISELSSLREQFQQLNQQLADLKSRYEQAQAKLTESESTKSQLQQRVAELESQLQELRAKASQPQSAQQPTQQLPSMILIPPYSDPRIQALEQHLAKLSSELGELKTSFSKIPELIEAKLKQFAPKSEGTQSQDIFSWLESRGIKVEVQQGLGPVQYTPIAMDELKLALPGLPPIKAITGEDFRLDPQILILYNMIKQHYNYQGDLSKFIAECVISTCAGMGFRVVVTQPPTSSPPSGSSKTG